ncbi:MAG: HpsJ-like protein, cyanoexosortase A-associated [Microcoleaceae cyanobacterium]
MVQTIPPLRWVGYGLLIFALIDSVFLLIPPQFTNAIWEFQTMGALVERVAVPLIGFALIFYGERTLRGKWEIPLLKTLSWLTLLLAILFLLLVPLGVLNTVRIEKQSSEQINTQRDQRKTQVQAIQQQLEQAKSEEQVETLLSRLQGRSPDIQGTEQLQEVKDQLTTFLDRADKSTIIQAEEIRKNRRVTLAKNSVKWNLGALIAAVLFFLFWKSTAWARRKG